MATKKQKLSWALSSKKYREKHSNRVRKNRKKRRVKENLRVREYRCTPIGWRKSIIPRLRFRAKKLGIECTISYKDLVFPELCPVFGVPFQFYSGNITQSNYASPSVDRIDNNKGYIHGNVCIISLRANLLKRDANIDELKKIINYMENYGGQHYNSMF